MDLKALNRRTERALKTAATDEDAKAAILGFVEGFHDGHLRAAAPLEASAGSAAALPKPDYASLSPAEGAAALGYAPISGVAFSLPFEALAGCRLESDGLARTFRASISASPGGMRYGLVRIPRFREQDGPPQECLREWSDQLKSGHGIDVTALRSKVSQTWFRTLADQLRRFKEEGVAAVLVDLGGNGGGNDSGDWAARLFTPREVHSAPLLLSAAPAAKAYFDEQLGGLRKALREQPQASAETRARIELAIGAFERRKIQAELRSWDLSWVWQERRPWNPTGSGRLVEAGFASGQFDYLPLSTPGDREALTSAYWAATVDSFRGAWDGPVYVLTDGRTASAAEMFAAVMRDNRIGKIVGTATLGAGAGFMLDEPPIELPHSHLRFQMPNCVRLRSDGSNEVSGIQPDLPVLPRQGENSRGRAARVLEAMDADLQRPKP
ncbi:MAG: hypothetical protein HY014_01555 [Acidobacteria bacterium]|nr:hypothetical protein [Acidobacteriota bacterium]MBI3486835.1 hypothetical protein [Acidobacteriota bacterium]